VGAELIRTLIELQVIVCASDFPRKIFQRPRLAARCALTALFDAFIHYFELFEIVFVAVSFEAQREPDSLGPIWKQATHSEDNARCSPVHSSHAAAVALSQLTGSAR